ncbi:hypothetical protein BDV34DRAFT_222583 [Aspergillus parasiticus]|uniref:Uncharacterized protein n=1 Tax=Aspergillus parasiticus TaxID=5067 RepID=A0A5N6DTI5_ASPPA|nr:hypothetical protein BDV34DRAFT_222583 [Aspergillus parasiticus]
MSEANNSEDQHVLFSQFKDPTGTTAQDWLLEEDGVETIRNLYPALNEEPQQPNPIRGTNDAQGLALHSASELYGVEIDFMSSGDYLQVHNYFANTRPSDMSHTVLDDFQSLAATTEFEPTVEAPQNPVTSSSDANSKPLNTYEHNKRDFSFIPDRDQIVTLAVRNSLQNIPNTDHTCHCWKELIFILERIELKDDTLEALQKSSVELALSLHRKAVENCTTMIACTYCRLSSERMMLLGLVVEKLVMEFGDLIRVCQEKGLFEALSDHHPRSSGDQATLPFVGSQALPSSSNTYFPNTTNTERRLFLGDYEVCSSEWAPLVKTLITLYAKKLKSLLSCCKMWATAANQSAMLVMFSNVEQQFEIISAIL